MTIAYVLKMYPRFSETFILNEILELERQGVDLHIYPLHMPNDGHFHANLARVRASVFYLPEYLIAKLGRVLADNYAVLRRNPPRYMRVLFYALRSRRPFKAFRRFLRAAVLVNHLQSSPISHLHAHFASSATHVAMFAHLLNGISYSFTAHAKDIFLNDVDTNLLREEIRAAKFVVTVSDFNRNYLQDIMTDHSGDIRRLYNGIDLDMFRLDSAALREPNLILGVGRLIEKKGWEDLIRACALLAGQGVSFQCEIIGKGPLEGKLKNLIAELGLQDRVKLIGARPQDEVLAAYRRATLFALPCVIDPDGNRDGLPTVLLEAMAAGLPVISTDVTGVPEIITDGIDGLVVPQNDPAALAHALDHLLVSPTLREQFTIAARRKAEREFDVRQNVAVLNRWFAEPASTQESHTPVAYARPQAAH